MAWSLSLTGTKVHIEHIESESAAPYWHVQDLWVAESELRILRGIRRNWALELGMPFRVVRDRIRFEDLSRRPYVPPTPDTHHRNETLARFADVNVGIQWARVSAPWTLTAGAGAWLPLGRTESNPFALGRAGRPHQHIQFGTGTVDPSLSIAASRRAGEWSLTAAAASRLTLAQNGHGYRAGDRFGASLAAARALPRSWALRGGLELAHERAEKWDGVIEEEGNLGRTDLFALLGVAYTLAFGNVSVEARVPVASDVKGAQMDLPLIVRLAYAR